MSREKASLGRNRTTLEYRSPHQWLLFLLSVSGWEVHPNRPPRGTGRELKGILSSSLTLSDYSICHLGSIVKTFIWGLREPLRCLEGLNELRHTKYTHKKRKCQVKNASFFGTAFAIARTIPTWLVWFLQPLRASEVSGNLWEFLGMWEPQEPLHWGLSQQEMSVYLNI